MIEVEHGAVALTLMLRYCGPEPLDVLAISDPRAAARAVRATGFFPYG